MNPELIEQIADRTAKLPLDPELCFWFDVSPDTAMTRVQKRDTVALGHDRFDQKGLDFRAALQERYDALHDRGLLTRIDAERELKFVWAELRSRVLAKLGL